MFNKRIKKFIDLINNDKRVVWITDDELKSSEDKCDDFREEINAMEIQGFLKVRSFTNTHNLSISLTSYGAFFGKDYIKDYEKIFDNVVSLVSSENPLTDDASIANKLNISRMFVDAVFEDLRSQDLVKIKTSSMGMDIYKFTNQGIDYFSNLNALSKA